MVRSRGRPQQGVHRGHGWQPKRTQGDRRRPPARRTALARNTSRTYSCRPGPGCREWHYHVYDYGWSGPVEASATVRFLISPPWLTRLWRLLGVAFSGLLLFAHRAQRPEGATGVAAARAAGRRCGRSAPPRAGCGRGAQRAGHGDARSTASHGAADATAGGTEVCARLRRHPRRASERKPAKRLDIVLEVSALDALGVALPGADPNWVPDTRAGRRCGGGLDLSHRARDPLCERGAGAARHPHGRFPGARRGALAGLRARRRDRSTVRAPGWEVAGINARRLISGALQLARRQVTQAQAGRGYPAGGVPGVRERRAASSPASRLDDRHRDRAHRTEVERIHPAAAAAAEGVGHHARTRKRRGTASRSGWPRRRRAPTSARSSPSANPWSSWPRTPPPTASTGALTWDRLGTSISAELRRSLPRKTSDTWLFEYYPRPGEHLKLTVTRPAAAPGGTLAFDHVELSGRVGKRSSSGVLQLTYRSTQGGQAGAASAARCRGDSVRSDNRLAGAAPGERRAVALGTAGAAYLGD